MECSDSYNPYSILSFYACLDNVCDNAHINKVNLNNPLYFMGIDGKIRTIKTLTVDINGNVILKEEIDT